MATQILMPALSPAMEEAKLARWLVRPGDRVEAGDVIAEIETDKAVLEFETPEAGTLVELLVSEGTEKIAVDTPIAMLLDQAEANAGAPAPGPPRARPLTGGDVARPRVARRDLPDWPDGTPTREVTLREALREAMAEEMRRDDSVFLIGEEVGGAPGTLGEGQGLIDAFGPDRVVDAPAVEHALAGLAVGAAFGGLRPVVKFLSFSFALQAMDQIVNSAAKTHYMSGGTLACPVVFRGPNGGAARMAAQHSQDLAAWFAHVPGLKVAVPYAASDAKGLLKSAIRDPNPVIFLEDETLYGRSFDLPEIDDHIVPFGKARIWREGGDVTLVSFGIGMLPTLAAADTLAREGIAAEVIDLRTLRPMDTARVIESVKKTNRCVTVEPGWPTGAIGKEIAATVMQEAFDWLDAPVLTVCGADVPLPYAAALEEAARPTEADVVAAAKSVCYR